LAASSIGWSAFEQVRAPGSSVMAPTVIGPSLEVPAPRLGWRGSAHELAGAERLDDVVICTEFEAEDLVDLSPRAVSMMIRTSRRSDLLARSRPSPSGSITSSRMTSGVVRSWAVRASSSEPATSRRTLSRQMIEERLGDTRLSSTTKIRCRIPMVVGGLHAQPGSCHSFAVDNLPRRARLQYESCLGAGDSTLAGGGEGLDGDYGDQSRNWQGAS
jgi:hypothetical protein